MNEMIAVAAALGSTSIWAFSSVKFQAAVAKYGAFTCNMFKSFVGMSLFWLSLAVLGFGGDLELASRNGNLMLVVSGLAGMAFGDWAYFAAMSHLGVRRATLIHGTAPIFLLVWALFSPNATISPLELGGVIMVVGGISLVSWRRRGRPAEKQPADSVSLARGYLFGGLAALGQAAGILLSHEALAECHPISGAAVRLTGAFLGLLAIQILRRRLGHTLRLFAESGLWRMMLMPSFLGTYIGIFFMMVAIEGAPPAVSGALLSTTPIFVIPFAVFMLKEKVTSRAILGTLVVVAGVALVSVGMK